jgi:hypothetical protein
MGTHADLLSATNWPTLAARALRNAETIAPSTARNPAVQHLAGIVAAQSGDRDVFRATPTSIPGAESADGLEGRTATHDARQRPRCGEPRARDEVHRGAQGLWLQSRGDLQQATGNATAAEAAYTQAAKIRPSPSLSRRIQKLQVKG